MKQFLSKIIPFRLRREIPDEQLLKGTPTEERLDSSPAPWILTVILVWLASAVFLTLTSGYATSAGNMALGSTALRDYRAPTSFDYNDRAKNRMRLEEILKEVPVFCRTRPGRTAEIQRDITDLFACVETRAAALRQQRPYEVIKDSPASAMTAAMSPTLLEELAAVYLKNRNYEQFQTAWQQMLAEGVLQTAVRAAHRSSMPVRTIDAKGRVGAVRRIGDIPDAVLAADRLTRLLFPQGGANAAEFRKILLRILGDGNLVQDEAKRNAATAEAKRSFRPEIDRIERGRILIKTGEVVTPALLELFNEAERNIPFELHPMVYYRAILSLLLLGVTIFFIFRAYPDMIQENRRIMLSGAILITTLAINYLSIKSFHTSIAPRLTNAVTSLSLQLFVPMAFCAILLTVTAGYRAAMCLVLYAAAVSVLMLSPEKPYELLLRYLVLTALAGLAVRKVTNYRTLFVRSLFAVAALVLILNCDLIFVRHRSLRELLEVAVMAVSNAFITAILTLVGLFLFELVFNVSTDMSLMVLCDYNHPLLERLKREAPGTMFHSMTVATLSEDAARSIGANPLKAKAGALFHDIGKLINARYFTENNSNSGKLHAELSPVQSAAIIRDHVLEGLRLARANRLCRLVRDAIRTHHGDSLVYFFYAKARAANPEAPVNEALFRYAGPPPRTRELTIISLADACEAAVRSLDHPDAAAIRSKVEEIFIGRVRDGQLRNSMLSLRELDKVKESFISTLMSIHHGRIAYTKENINEAAAKQMEQSPSPPSGPAKA